MKVIYLPLDERPCNYFYPQQLAAATDIDFVLPPKELLGEKKKPASFAGVKEWLQTHIGGADYLLVSLDMLLYGGIVPSRLHTLSVTEIKSRLQTLAELKAKNHKLKIFAFNLIMRVPSYNSSDEEPDYYGIYGERICAYGKLVDKQERGILTNEEKVKLDTLKSEIPEDVLEDFIGRRNKNFAINQLAIDFTDQNIIDYLIIPLDDNAEYGFSPREQRLLSLMVDERNLYDQVTIYPGADEIGCTLFAKVFCEHHHYTPSFFIRYSSTKGPFIIPKCEDRSLHESIKSHITAMGGIIAEHSINASAVLMVHSPAVSQDDMAEPVQTVEQRDSSYFSEINYREFIQAIKYYLSEEKTIGLADVALCNGSDATLMKMLQKAGILHQLHAYAGWNTSGNTLGTVIAHTMIEAYYREFPQNGEKAVKSKEFYYARLIEDWGYQAIVRTHLLNVIPQYGGSYFDISKNLYAIENLIKKELNLFIQKNLQSEDNKVQLTKVYSPWKRMFEVGIEISVKKRKKIQEEV